MASTGRHSYSIPGASLLKPRSSSKQPQTNYALAPTSSRDRDTRQGAPSRAYNVPQEVHASRSAPAPRPPSANEYRTQSQPQVHQSGGYASVTHFPSSHPPASHPSSYSNSRPLPSMPQRSNTAPQASSSRTRLEVPVTESRGGGVFAKMFSRVRSTSTPAQQPSPAGSGTEDNQKSSRRHKRSESAQAQPVAYLATSTSMNPPPSAPPTGRSMYDQQASRPVNTREAEREERRRRKESEKEKAKEERHREKDERRAKEKQRAEAAMLEAKQRADQQAAAKAAKATKLERDRERPPSRREEKQSVPATNQAPIVQPGNTTPPTRDSQQVPTTQPSLRHPGVPIQPSNSSSQSTVSNRGYASNPAVPSTQRVSLDVPATGPRPSSSSLPPGLPGSDEKARKDNERDRDREERRVRRSERERQKEAERLAAMEREREIERLERERRELRERERERERSFRHRSQREKAYSLPVNMSGLMSGSDNEKSSRKESRHGRSQTQSVQMVPQMQPYATSTEFQRPDPRRDNSAYIPPPTEQNPQMRYDHIVYPRMSQMNQTSSAHPPAVPPKYEQSGYQRAASDLGPFGHQSAAPRPPDRAHTDPVGVPPPVLNGSTHTSVAMVPWPEPYQQSNQPKVVSIHAAQGPPDNSPTRYEQKMLERPATELLVSHSSGQDYDGHGRQPSQDYSIPPGRSASASIPVPRVPSAMSGQPQTVPTYVSNSSSRYHSSSSQPQPMMMNPMNADAQYQPRTYNTNTYPQGERILSPPGGPSMLSPHGLGAPPISTPMHSSNSGLQAENGYTSSSMPTSAPHQVSQGNSPKGYTASTNTTQNQGNSPKSYNTSQVPSQAQLPTSVSRAASNNSNNSPSQRTLPQVAGVSQGGLFPPPGAVSRTPSNNSQVTMPGYSYQQGPQPQPTQGHHTMQNPAVQAIAMYSSAQNSSAASRSSFVPSNQQQHVLSAHSQPQPHSQPQHSSSYPYSTSTVSLQNVLPRSDVRSSPSMSSQQQQQQYPMHPSSSSQNVHYSSNPSTYSHADTHTQPQAQGVSSASAYYASLSSHPSSYTASANAAQPPNPTAASSQQPHPSTPMYNNTGSRPLETKPPQQQQPPSSAQKASTPQQPTGEVHSYPSDGYETSRTPRPYDYPPNQYSSSSSHQATSYLMATAPQPTSVKSPEPTSRHVSDSSVSLSRQQTPHQADLPSAATPKSSVLQMLTTQSIAQPTPVRSQQDIAASTATRVALPGLASNRPSSRLQEFDSPPPLTPSTSSHESHEEILMTPSSLDTAKVEQQEVSVSIQRPEKKKAGGIFGMFRSTSKSPKESRELDESKEHEHEHESRRTLTPGPSQRPEGGNKLRSMKLPPAAAANPLKAETVPAKESAKLTKASARHVPPPIAIPPHALAVRLVSSKSKRYRTMSAASLEALDGTANNTVVGSPTSTVRSPTPGPMTPPIRDPVEAAQEWRNKEEMVYMTRGSHRRRRPGVTFDLLDDDARPKGHRQVRASRVYAQRGDTSE